MLDDDRLTGLTGCAGAFDSGVSTEGEGCSAEASAPLDAFRSDPIGRGGIAKDDAGLKPLLGPAALSVCGMAVVRT